MRKCLIVAAALAAHLSVPLGTTAHATEGAASLYFPGLRGPMAGIVPPPGFYFGGRLPSPTTSTRSDLGQRRSP